MLSFPKTLAFISLTALFSATSYAEVINTDLIESGDNLVISDTDTGLNFLKLTETIGISVAQIQEELNSTYLGWRFATSDEVTLLLDNLFADSLASVGGYDSLADNSYFEDLSIAGISDIVGWKLYVGTRKISYGLVYEGGSSSSLYGFYSTSPTGSGFYNDYSEYSIDLAKEYYGTWLVQDESYISDVNAPLAISSIFLFGLASVRRKREITY